MGLDLIPEGKAKRGHEAEWRSLIERSFAEEELSGDMQEIFQEISIPAYASIGAPRVGFDASADAWILQQHGATTPEEIAQCLDEHHGYYVLELLGPPGVPEFSNGGLYDGVDRTSFRGSFLRDCESLLGHEQLSRAWVSMMPEEAVAYGKDLLRVAKKAAADLAKRKPRKRWLWFRRKPKGEALIDEQIEIVHAAGAWYVFWGERGHPIRAWF